MKGYTKTKDVNEPHGGPSGANKRSVVVSNNRQNLEGIPAPVAKLIKISQESALAQEVGLQTLDHFYHSCRSPAVTSANPVPSKGKVSTPDESPYYRNTNITTYVKTLNVADVERTRIQKLRGAARSVRYIDVPDGEVAVLRHRDGDEFLLPEGMHELASDQIASECTVLSFKPQTNMALDLVAKDEATNTIQSTGYTVMSVPPLQHVKLTLMNTENGTQLLLGPGVWLIQGALLDKVWRPDYLGWKGLSDELAYEVSEDSFFVLARGCMLLGKNPDGTVMVHNEHLLPKTDSDDAIDFDPNPGAIVGQGPVVRLALAQIISVVCDLKIARHLDLNVKITLQANLDPRITPSNALITELLLEKNLRGTNPYISKNAGRRDQVAGGEPEDKFKSMKVPAVHLQCRVMETCVKSLITGQQVPRELQTTVLARGTTFNGLPIPNCGDGQSQYTQDQVSKKVVQFANKYVNDNTTIHEGKFREIKTDSEFKVLTAEIIDQLTKHIEAKLSEELNPQFNFTISLLQNNIEPTQTAHQKKLLDACEAAKKLEDHGLRTQADQKLEEGIFKTSEGNLKHAHKRAQDLAKNKHSRELELKSDELGRNSDNDQAAAKKEAITAGTDDRHNQRKHAREVQAAKDQAELDQIKANSAAECGAITKELDDKTSDRAAQVAAAKNPAAHLVPMGMWSHAAPQHQEMQRDDVSDGRDKTPVLRTGA